ncbi:apoptosis-inducing factor 3 isoform X1 [Vespula squamosa]|uniref:Apoptosis-inducing factor 3 isoform X1 n=1 Tax=Vespula squamosa TaxID=30214 RepID=A0ABD2A970_VESSQ
MGLKHCKEFSSTDEYERERYKSTEKVLVNDPNHLIIYYITVIGYDDTKNIYFKRTIIYTIDSTVCKAHNNSKLLLLATENIKIIL